MYIYKYICILYKYLCINTYFINIHRTVCWYSYIYVLRWPLKWRRQFENRQTLIAVYSITIHGVHTTGRLRWHCVHNNLSCCKYTQTLQWPQVTRSHVFDHTRDRLFPLKKEKIISSSKAICYIQLSFIIIQWKKTTNNCSEFFIYLQIYRYNWTRRRRRSGRFIITEKNNFLGFNGIFRWYDETPWICSI